MLVRLHILDDLRSSVCFGMQMEWIGRCSESSIYNLGIIALFMLARGVGLSPTSAPFDRHPLELCSKRMG
jgi:hypothetical protein